MLFLYSILIVYILRIAECKRRTDDGIGVRNFGSVRVPKTPDEVDYPREEQ